MTRRRRRRAWPGLEQVRAARDAASQSADDVEHRDRVSLTTMLCGHQTMLLTPDSCFVSCCWRAGPACGRYASVTECHAEARATDECEAARGLCVTVSLFPLPHHTSNCDIFSMNFHHHLFQRIGRLGMGP